MPLHRLPVVDADGHVYETDRELSEHFEGRYRELKRLGTFPLFPTLDGWPRALSAPDSSPGVTPEVWRSFLDEAGIGQAVLYPTAGLALGLIQKAEWAVALARAYNNWLAERYLRADPAFRGVALLPVHATRRWCGSRPARTFGAATCTSPANWKNAACPTSSSAWASSRSCTPRTFPTSAPARSS